MNEVTDYASWSNADLVRRVTELEAQLRAQNSLHGRREDSVKTSPPPKKKQKKAPKQFDASRYSTRLIALKFAYLGGRYNGFEHHTNNTTPLPTIEEEIWKALHKTKLIFPTRKPGESEDEVSWEGCEYSKCGRTDRGVSAFGQVIGVRVRSNRPKHDTQDASASLSDGPDGGAETTPDCSESTSVAPQFDSVRDELSYIQIVNRVLPPDIRILAWCPNPPPDFSARFNCKERRYRYFFTNPAFAPIPVARGQHAEQDGDVNSQPGVLDIEAMQDAASRYEGVHDFRNFCKVDPGKQITTFVRRIYHAGIHEFRPASDHAEAQSESYGLSTPKLYYFEVRGSAFLWHQVRHLVAMLFLVGQGLEQPTIIDELLDIQRTPAKPKYEMASDVPLVLWDCIFPAGEDLHDEDRNNRDAMSVTGYEDSLDWVYVGDENGGRESKSLDEGRDGKFGRSGIMENLWALWRKSKMDENLAWSLMEMVALQGQRPDAHLLQALAGANERSACIFDGGEFPRAVGKYLPVMQRDRMEEPDVVNARYAARKGIVPRGEEGRTSESVE